MFGKSLNIGEFKIEYYSEIEANIIDKTIPIMNLPDNDSKMLSFSFPFLIITKLLYNFPPPSGMIALKEGYTNLDQKLDPDNFSKCNVSLLDNFSKKPIVFKKLNKKEEKLSNVVDRKICISPKKYYAAPFSMISPSLNI